jgi:hypothetical protein
LGFLALNIGIALAVIPIDSHYIGIMAGAAVGLLAISAASMFARRAHMTASTSPARKIQFVLPSSQFESVRSKLSSGIAQSLVRAPRQHSNRNISLLTNNRTGAFTLLSKWCATQSVANGSQVKFSLLFREFTGKIRFYGVFLP